METIDLSESGHVNTLDRYSLADTLSIKTDLTDLGPGRETKRNNLKDLSESVILSVSSLGENMRQRVRGPGVEEERGWARRSRSPAQANCKVCKHKRGVSCCSLIGLLLIDLLTLLILIYGYKELSSKLQDGGKEENTEL